ncbi:MAG: hypothetical protein N2578_01475 [Bdellovibrionaceae bacterium]|nr:hypothetical protein [Pseudobdellovibrionaceae bacterium]
MIKKVFLYFIGFMTAACSSSSETLPSGLRLRSETESRQVIESMTRKEEKYSGLYNTVTLSATLQTSDVLAALDELRARQGLWDATKFAEERQKTLEESRKKTEIFMSFYTPERKHDNLTKSDTRWQIFLDNGGRRYKASVKRLRQEPAEIAALFPHHTRFATPYILTFDVPVTQVETSESKLTVTGPIDSVTLTWGARPPATQ